MLNESAGRQPTHGEIADSWTPGISPGDTEGRASGVPLGKVAASYARRSSGRQGAASIAAQHRMCRDWAARHGYSIPDELQFTEEAVSGTKLAGDGLQQTMEAARARRFEVLYFENLSRMARKRPAD